MLTIIGERDTPTDWHTSNRCHPAAQAGALIAGSTDDGASRPGAMQEAQHDAKRKQTRIGHASE